MHQMNLPLIVLVALLSILHQETLAQSACRGLTAPPEAQGCFCFLVSGQEILEQYQNLDIPELDLPEIDLPNATIPDVSNLTIPSPGPVSESLNLTNSCFVAAQARVTVEDFDEEIFFPVGPVSQGGSSEWTGAVPGPFEDICTEGDIDIPLSGQVIELKKDHGREATGSECEEKGCFSVDTDVVFGDKVMPVGMLKAGDGSGEVLHVQHGTKEVRKNVLCVKNDKNAVLCATTDHVVKHDGERRSMEEVCKIVECYERRNVRVVNPILRSGLAKSTLEGFELTDEVDWKRTPRLVTRIGARLLAELYKMRDGFMASPLFHASLSKNAL